MLSRTPISKGCRAEVYSVQPRGKPRGVLLTRVLSLSYDTTDRTICGRLYPNTTRPCNPPHGRVRAAGGQGGRLQQLKDANGRCDPPRRGTHHTLRHRCRPQGLYIDGELRHVCRCAEGHQLAGVQDSHPIAIHQSVSSVRDNQLGCICEEQSKSALQ